jgi:short chain dehydrogenase
LTSPPPKLALLDERAKRSLSGDTSAPTMASEDPQPMAAGRRAKSLTIVVTGATGGIGFATAAGLARLGHRIVVTGRDETRGPAAAEEWRQRARTARSASRRPFQLPRAGSSR